MRTALAIARKDLRQRIRDRSAIVVGVIAPVADRRAHEPCFQRPQQLPLHTWGSSSSITARWPPSWSKALDAPQLEAGHNSPDSSPRRRSPPRRIRSGELAAALGDPGGLLVVGDQRAPRGPHDGHLEQRHGCRRVATSIVVLVRGAGERRPPRVRHRPRRRRSEGRDLAADRASSRRCASPCRPSSAPSAPTS